MLLDLLEKSKFFVDYLKKKMQVRTVVKNVIFLNAPFAN